MEEGNVNNTAATGSGDKATATSSVASGKQQAPRSITQLLQAIAPSGKQEHDPSDPHHRLQCMWCSGKIQQSLGGSFGIFANNNGAASHGKTRNSQSPFRGNRDSSSFSASSQLPGSLVGALADERISDRIARLEKVRDATNNQRIKAAIVSELLALHKSVLPGD
jgi:hypothetical protein